MNSVEQSVHITNKKDFTKIIKERERVVALFYAQWCPYCVRFLPVFERAVAATTQAGETKQENLHFAMVEDVEELEDQYGVEVVPTVLCFEKGALSKRLDGVLGVGLNETQLAKFLDGLAHG